MTKSLLSLVITAPYHILERAIKLPFKVLGIIKDKPAKK